MSEFIAPNSITAITEAEKRGERNSSNEGEAVETQLVHDDLLQRALANAYCIEQREADCEECGHPVRLHADRYGCEFERGDAYIDDVLQALGPCGCKAHAELRKYELVSEAEESAT